MAELKGENIDCPKCGGKTRIYDTYWSTKWNAKARRRSCDNCGGMFRTIETIVQGTFKGPSARKPGYHK